MANKAPKANSDSYSTNENAILKITASNSVLKNDSDPERDALSVVLVNGFPFVGTTTFLPSGAKLKLNANGSFDYDPNGIFDYLLNGQNGTDSFTYKVSDGNGGFDTAAVSITIKGVNSKPVAKDDTDKVSTGATTVGNVISGVDPDAPDKKLILQADTKGDGTNFIRSITHDGITYTLSSNKSTVSVSGSPAPAPGSWSYNNATGDLTIRTELGGTLKINLDGDGSTAGKTPGNYAYTAPPSVQWGMPLSDPQMGYGDSVSTWLARFASGVELKAFNATGGVAPFGSKDLSFQLGSTNYKYGGIGVSASGGRDAETDFIAPNKAEHIEATFATALNKVTIGVAALFGGPNAAYDAPYSENLIWKAYNAAGAVIGQGTVSGTANGLVQFTIELAGIKRISLTPGENSANTDVGGRESDFLLQFIDGGAADSAREVFTYKLEDADGDQSSANLSITVNDAQSAINHPPTSTNDTVTTDEDTAIVLALSDFGSYSDIENTPIAAVKITTLASAGTLQYDTTGLGAWAAVAPDQEISAASIAAGKLRFVPAADASGTPYATASFKVGDGTDFSAAAYTLTFTVVGANDPVTITSGAQSGSLVEDETTAAAGTISFNDVDLSDGHSASFAASASNTTTFGTFSLDPVSEAANAADGSVTWHYALNASAQALAAGQVVTETYLVTINDGHGSAPVQNVTLTITGANDPVTITSGAQSGSLVEDETTAAAGTISFNDVDLSDGHTASFAASASNTTTFGTFSLDPVSEAANAADGSVTWHYALNASAQALAAGQVATETYTVTLDDGHGSAPVQNVTLTITGANDLVTITSGAQSGAVAENGSLAAAGTIDFNDVDLSDTHTRSFASSPTNTTSFGTFSVDAVSEAANAANGSVTWHYALNNTAARVLTAGQVVTETYTVTLDDGHGSTVNQNVVITITGTSSDVSVATLAPVQGFIVQGDTAGDSAGFMVSDAGDVNGDGLADFIVSAMAGDDGGLNAGEVYVLFGSTSGFGTNVGGRQVIDLTTLTPAQGFIIQGDAANDLTGYGAATAGDVNGDGFDDVIVGAPRGDDGGLDAGEGYVVFGSASAFGTLDAFGRQVIDLSTLTAAQGFIIQGDSTALGGSSFDVSDQSGRRVSSVGDLNGDGFDDVMIGAPAGDDGGIDAGEAYVVFGSGSGFGTPVTADGYTRQVIDLTQLSAAQGFVIQGDLARGNTGWDVSLAGDVNGDGFDDAILSSRFGADGGPAAGEGYVIFGHAGGFGTPVTADGFTRQVIDLATLSAAEGFIIQGDSRDDNAGSSVSAAGDVNGDGFDDVLVGTAFDYGLSPTFSFSFYNAYVVFGGPSDLGTPDVAGRQVVDLTTLSAAQGFVMRDTDRGSIAGRIVSSAGDVNGDGFDDIIVGTPYGNYSFNHYAGRAHVVFGTASGFGTPVAGRQVIDLNALTPAQGFTIDGDGYGEQAGFSVSSAGDVNGDGFDDMMVGARYGSDGGGRAGEAYVVFGGNFGAGTTPVTTSGTGAAEILIGGLGNDILSGGGGADVIRSGAGDDLISIADTAFQRIDGGSGQDTLRAAFSLDLSAIGNARISNIEAIDLTGGGSNTLTMRVEDVFDLSEIPNAALAASGFVGDLSHKSLVVMGNAGDTVTLVTPGAGEVGAGGVWSNAGVTTISGESYDVMNFLLSGQVLASVALHDGLLVV